MVRSAAKGVMMNTKHVILAALFFLAFSFTGRDDRVLAAVNVPLTVTNDLAAARTADPVTMGLPLSENLNITDASNLRILDGTGAPIPAQLTPLARWGGGPNDTSAPIRWLLMDFQASVNAGGSASYSLQSGGPGPSPLKPITVTNVATAVTVNTGAARFSISKTNGHLTGTGISGSLYGRANIGGAEYTTSGSVTVTTGLQGPMRASIEVKGSYRSTEGTAVLDYTSRYWFYAGKSFFRLFHTVENNNLCPLDGTEQPLCRDIGSGNSVNIDDISLVLSTGFSGDLDYTAGTESGSISGDLTADLLLYQDSSGTAYWNKFITLTDYSENPLDTRPRMQAYVTFRGYRTTLGGVNIDQGNQVPGWVTVSNGASSWTALVRHFWQNFPKAIRVAGDGDIEVGLFPSEYGGTGFDFNLRAGEHKTHEVLFSLNESNPSALLDVLRAKAGRAWYVNSRGFGRTAQLVDSDWLDYENYIRYQLDTSPEHTDAWSHYYRNLITAIEHTDFYGIFDFGDWPIDYEGYGVAPLNAKYDMDLGCWSQWARGGDDRWLELAEALARHTADIDILHNLHSPRHWADGIAWGHSAHDESGFTNPHRNSNSGHVDTAYGMAGMLLTYYLTGYEKALEAALELADCAEYRLHNDYNLCGYFEECTGYGYALPSPGLYNDGSRPAANVLFITAAAYRATGDGKYLTVADALVHWARSEQQPYIDGPTGSDSYVKVGMLNLYLRALAEYIDMRSEFGLSDTWGAENTYLALADWLHLWPWVSLASIDTGTRAAYPYEWYFDEREGSYTPDVGNWTLIGADAMGYAHILSNNPNYLNWGTELFRTGTRDPFFEGDPLIYTEVKQTINSITFGQNYLNARSGGAAHVYYDFNGDGQVDVLYRHPTNGNVGLWLMDGAKEVTWVLIGNHGTAWDVKGVGDFNGDGFNDIVYRHICGNIGVWLMENTVEVDWQRIGNHGTVWDIRGVGDFNGDGYADVLYRQTTTGKVGVWLMNGIDESTWVLIGNHGTFWDVKGIGDFNRDGSADVLYSNTTGKVGIWLMDGPNETKWNYLGNHGTYWQPEGVADYNNDGQVDVVYQNTNSTVGVWLMDGTTEDTWQRIGNHGVWEVR